MKGDRSTYMWHCDDEYCDCSRPIIVEDTGNVLAIHLPKAGNLFRTIYDGEWVSECDGPDYVDYIDQLSKWKEACIEFEVEFPKDAERKLCYYQNQVARGVHL